jgi:hypothetical protein
VYERSGFLLGIMIVIGLRDTSTTARTGWSMPFSNYRDNYDAATLTILRAAFDEAWEVLTTSGGSFDQEATRTALADLIMSFAAEGETNPKRLKELALAALPRTLEAS